jgi:hypothetical protein
MLLGFRFDVRGHLAPLGNIFLEHRYEMPELTKLMGKFLAFHRA